MPCIVTTFFSSSQVKASIPEKEIAAATSFWMPVGVSIFSGGIGALIMVVTMLPVIYWKLYEKKGDDKKNQTIISQQINR